MGTRRTRRFWLCWALALAVTAVWTISASPVQTSQPVGGAAHGSYVALTFDDGPWPGTTNTLLDGLAQRGVKATFFLVGEQVADRAERPSAAWPTRGTRSACTPGTTSP